LWRCTILHNWVLQKVSSTGTGDLLLGGSVASYIRFSAVFADGATVYYSIQDGSNRENGLGTYVAASNKITRDTIYETLDNGLYDNSTPTALNLSGAAQVANANSVEALAAHFVGV